MIVSDSFKKLIPIGHSIRTHIRNVFFLAALTAGVVLMPAGPASAQTFATLHHFTGGGDGANPYAGLVLSSNVLYGTAWGGGSLDNGTVFAVNTNGTDFKVLHNFTGGNDGSSPYAGLILSGGILYGTALGGGTENDGTVFKISTQGAGFAVLHSFTGSDGSLPYGGLVLSGATLYGTTSQGAGSSGGIVFSVSTAGTGFSILHNFAARADGANLYTALTLSGDSLYGTALFGGGSDNGTVFAVKTNGMDFTNVYNFTTLEYAANSDGAFPYAAVILSSNLLYGTAWGGGDAANGTVFAVSTNGTGFTTLHVFAATSQSGGPNNDGTFPMAGLVLLGNTLYGTATDGGTAGAGTVFEVNTDGTSFAVLHDFTAVNIHTGANSDGATPQAGVLLSGNKLYGTAWEGGNYGYGTVFSLTLTPQLTVTVAGTNAVLTWPANFAGFTLQSTPILGPPAVWTAVSSAPNVLNGRNTVTNLVTGARNFLRLIQ